MSHLPSIRITGGSASSSAAVSVSYSQNRDVSSPSMPVPIRNAHHNDVPPPLPPPRHLPHLAGDQSSTNKKMPPLPEDSSKPTLARLQSEDHLTLRSAHNSAEQFDRQLLSRFDKRGAPISLPPPDAIVAKKPTTLQPLSVPGPESPRTRWAGYSPPSTNSPRSATFRSPLSESHTQSQGHGHSNSHSNSQSHTHTSTQSPRNLNGPIPYRHHDEHSSVFNELEFGHDEQVMRDLNLSDKSPSSQGEDSHGNPLKRRAPSPILDRPEERMSPYGPPNEFARRGPYPYNRHSPGSRPFHSHSDSMGSYQSSTNSHWNNSIASSATSYWSDKYPESGSSSMEPDFIPYHPYVAPRRQSGDVRNYETVRTVPDIAPDGIPIGQYACECCPKKPKRFHTVLDLQRHESEKAWKCNFCNNRFKNKNEAERHQNSLHLRRFSWSCAALTEPRHAFQPNPLSRNQTSSCGYCGREFANCPEDWKERADHLRLVHKYGDCNQHKKFYRADHFRQHLKHSHQATSGKWTNILETACVRDEPLPVIAGGIEPKVVVPQIELPPLSHPGIGN